MSIQSWFPTSIYCESLAARPRSRIGSLKRFNAELLEQCYLVEETDGDGQSWSKDHYRHGYTSYGSIVDLHERYPHFSELANHTDRHVQRFARYLEMDLQDGRLSMSSCWVNIMPTHAAHSLHLHPLSVISGTYYVAIPKNASALKFEDPRLSRLMAAPAKLPNAKSRNQPFATLQPRAGDVALWESWLRHEVPPNSSREDRVSISFNYSWS